MTEPLLDVRGLQKFFPIAEGFFQRVTGHVRAVDGVDGEVIDIAQLPPRGEVMRDIRGGENGWCPR